TGVVVVAGCVGEAPGVAIVDAGCGVGCAGEGQRAGQVFAEDAGGSTRRRVGGTGHGVRGGCDVGRCVGHVDGGVGVLLVVGVVVVAGGVREGPGIGGGAGVGVGRAAQIQASQVLAHHALGRASGRVRVGIIGHAVRRH